jgi:hypothetical protein
MKILLVNDHGLTAGGAECIILSLRDELRRRGADATAQKSIRPQSP